MATARVTRRVQVVLKQVYLGFYTSLGAQALAGRTCHFRQNFRPGPILVQHVVQTQTFRGSVFGVGPNIEIKARPVREKH